VNSTEALVDVAESLLEQYGYVKNREVIAIVAGTRTKSGSTNFLRLHVLGEHNQEGVRFFAPHHQETLPDPESALAQPKAKRSSRIKSPGLHRYPSPNPPKISNP
jgi:pyruvate kinase